MRKLLTTVLALAILGWAEAGLAQALVESAMQCSMSTADMQAMGDMPCCPGEEMSSAAMAQERPPCCSVSSVPEQPLGFLVSAEQANSPALAVVAVLPPASAAPAADRRGIWQSADAPRFVKPILELKTDLRI